MPTSDTRTSLLHMMDHAKEALDTVSGKTRRDLDCERQLNLSPVRLLEIVGEAAGRIPIEHRALCPDIPWGQIVSLRNRLIHGYDSVNFDILWKVVTEDLPPLMSQLEDALSRDFPP